MIGGGMYGCPKYNVWQQGLEGQAELARAEQNRQIRINEAKAKKEAAAFEADAEIERARGIAEANKIIGDSLKDNEGYLRWLFIDMLRETGGDGRETIYIPTEAGMPIMEAGRLDQPQYGPRIDK
jgi:regulator of protease activity HflC (stomatin/prohibitin superfamily)